MIIGMKLGLFVMTSAFRNVYQPVQILVNW